MVHPAYAKEEMPVDINKFMYNTYLIHKMYFPNLYNAIEF